MKLFRKKPKVDMTKIPNCVAFIIDGNGRWAQKRGLPRMLGHRAGIDAVKKAIENCNNLGINEIMFYCFSTENWNRPKAEVDGLFELFREFVNNDADEYLQKNYQFKLCGGRERIPSDIIKKVEEIEEKTKNCNGMKVALCINYGGRYDIINAVNKLLSEKKNSVSEQEFEHYLLTDGLSDPDLIIRTSGEKRISNFLLYQMAYSELYFTDTFWPDFDNFELVKAICDFQRRNRRFGAIKE